MRRTRNGGDADEECDGCPRAFLPVDYKLSFPVYRVRLLFSPFRAPIWAFASGFLHLLLCRDWWGGNVGKPRLPWFTVAYSGRRFPAELLITLFPGPFLPLLCDGFAMYYCRSCLPPGASPIK